MEISQIFLEIQQWKNFENRLNFDYILMKRLHGCFYDSQWTFSAVCVICDLAIEFGSAFSNRTFSTPAISFLCFPVLHFHSLILFILHFFQLTQLRKLCAVVLLHRPLYLNYRALITMETFSILSNVVIDSPVSLLRFVTQLCYGRPM